MNTLDLTGPYATTSILQFQDVNPVELREKYTIGTQCNNIIGYSSAAGQVRLFPHIGRQEVTGKRNMPTHFQHFQNK
jgi:hypothetical protein